MSKSRRKAFLAVLHFFAVPVVAAVILLARLRFALHPRNARASPILFAFRNAKREHATHTRVYEEVKALLKWDNEIERVKARDKPRGCKIAKRLLLRLPRSAPLTYKSRKISFCLF